MTTQYGSYTLEEALQKAGYGRFQCCLLILLGWINAEYSVQVFIPVFLIPLLDDVWDLSSPWDSMVGVVFLVGAMFGNVVTAKVADKYGRRKALIMGTFVLAISSTATGLVSNLYSLLICRFFCGCGCVTAVEYSLFIEFSPMSYRAKCVIFLTFFFTIGALVNVLIAWLIVPMDEDETWRYYVLATSIPAWVSLVISYIVPESPRWYCTIGELDKAEETIEAVFKMNKIGSIAGNLVKENNKITERGKVCDLFVHEYRWTTLLLWLNFLLTMYYGIDLLSERLFEDYDLYLSELITTVSEIPAMILGWWTINKTGRKMTIVYSMAVSSIGMIMIVLLWNDTSSESYVWIIIIISVFAVRGALLVHSITLTLYVSEYFPTAIRATAISCSQEFSKLGSILGTFLSEDLSVVNSTAVITILTAIGFFTSGMISRDTTYKELTNEVDRTGSQKADYIIKGGNSKEYVLVSSV